MWLLDETNITDTPRFGRLYLHSEDVEKPDFDESEHVNMSENQDIALIDELRGLPTETEWLEFKRNRYEPQQIGEYLSALANSACIAAKTAGYLVFGIDDETHEVVGTDFDPYITKGRAIKTACPGWGGVHRMQDSSHVLSIIRWADRVFEVGPREITR